MRCVWVGWKVNLSDPLFSWCPGICILSCIRNTPEVSLPHISKMCITKLYEHFSFLFYLFFFLTSWDSTKKRNCLIRTLYIQFNILSKLYLNNPFRTNKMFWAWSSSTHISSLQIQWTTWKNYFIYTQRLVQEQQNLGKKLNKQLIDVRVNMLGPFRQYF